MAGAERPRLWGRDDELTLLRELAGEVRGNGGGVLAVIRGEAGIGKTALLDRLVADAAGMGFSIGRGKADELDLLAPLSSLMSCLRAGPRPLLSGEEFLDLARGHDQRIWLVERLAELIEARAIRVPVLIALDDVQWTDHLSRFALRVLPTRLRSSPVLWLLTDRAASGGVSDEIASGELPAVNVALGPLAGAAIEQLARDALGRDVDEPTRSLLDGAGGNPFLAAEMLAGLAASGRDGTDPPARLVLGVRGRLSSLRPDTLRFLRMGAVLGQRFTFADAATLSGHQPDALVGELEEAVHHGLLDDDGELLAFRHDLLRQAVYADIPPSARKALHRAAAAQLVASGRRPVEAAPHVYHGAQPGDEQAVALLRKAAADVLAAMPMLAAELTSKALELVAVTSPLGFEVGAEVIVSLTRAGKNREALAAGDKLLARQPSVATFGRLQAVLGAPLWNLDLVEELLRRTETALAMSVAPPVEARLAGLRALAMSRGPDLVAARQAGERALRAATATQDREAHVTALRALGETALNDGDCDTALGRFSALRAIDPAFAAEEIIAYQHVDDFAASERLLAAAQQDQDGGSPRPAMLLWAQANHQLGLGRLDDAEVDLLTLERMEQDTAEPVNTTGSRVERGWIALQRGDLAAAHACLRSAEAAGAEQPNPAGTATVRFLEAILLDAAGDQSSTVELLRLSEKDGPVMRWRPLRTRICFAVRLALRVGELSFANELAAQAEAYARRNPGVPGAMGIAAHAAGLVRADPEPLTRAVELLAASRRPLVRAAAEADLGSALLAAGRRQAAVEALASAHDTFVACGATGEAARVRATGPDDKPAGVAARPIQGWEALTATEKKVARLIAEGHTNRSAAEQLVVSPHTINTHLASIFRKLSVNSRVRLANVVLSR